MIKIVCERCGAEIKPGKIGYRLLGGKMKITWLDECCNSCGEQINSWDKRLSRTLAYKYPCCEKCIAKEYDMDVAALRDKMENFFGMRPCQGI